MVLHLLPLFVCTLRSWFPALCLLPPPDLRHANVTIRDQRNMVGHANRYDMIWGKFDVLQRFSGSLPYVWYLPTYLLALPLLPGKGRHDQVTYFMPT